MTFIQTKRYGCPYHGAPYRGVLLKQKTVIPSPKQLSVLRLGVSGWFFAGKEWQYCKSCERLGWMESGMVLSGIRLFNGLPRTKFERGYKNTKLGNNVLKKYKVEPCRTKNAQMV